MANLFLLPDVGEGLTEAEIVEWFVEVGDRVSADQPLVAVETDKTLVELPAPVAGTLLHRGAGEGVVLLVGEILAVIGESGESWESDSAVSPTPQEAGVTTPSSGRDASGVEAVTPGETNVGSRPLALPLVRKEAARAGVDLANIQGTGAGGRITRADLADHLSMRSSSKDPVVERPPLVGTLQEDAEDLSATETPHRSNAPALPGTTIRLSATRRAIASHLTRSWNEIPHVTTFDAFDASRLLEARRAISARWDVSIPLEALVVKSVVPALAAHPVFNATLEGDQLTLHDRYDIGIAIDSDEGLLVGVVRGADRLSMVETQRAIATLVESARNRSLSRDETSGATFTVSNIGAVGGGYGTPIVPYGTTAILSIGRAEDAPVARDGKVVILPMAPLSLSYDHRVIDGALGRAFLAHVKSSLSEPTLLLA